MHWDEESSVSRNVARVLEKETEIYFESGQAAMVEGVTWRGLHDFRLHTKRFRYTLELFEDLYGPAYAARMEKIKVVQQLLGDINDCVATRSLLKKTPGADPLRAKLQTKAQSLIRKLRLFWKKEFSAPGAHQGWILCVKRPRKAVAGK